MDFSKYIQLQQEAANVYQSRAKTVDSSFLSLQRQQKAASSGFNNIQAIPYFNGAPVLNNAFGTSNTPADHAFTDGFASANRYSQQGDIAIRNAGRVVCNAPDYSQISTGVQLKSYGEASTILSQYTFDASKAKAYGYGLKPGELKPYGYGQSYFPKIQPNCTNDYYPPAVWPYR